MQIEMTQSSDIENNKKYEIVISWICCEEAGYV